MTEKQLPVKATGALLPAVSQSDLTEGLQALQALMKTVMVEGEHYGKVPGCGDKPALFKPGAELLCEFYQLIPEIEFLVTTEDWDRVPELFDYTIKVTLKRKSDNSIVAVGVGSCNSYEAKYKYRPGAVKGGRECPECKKTGTVKRSGFPNKDGAFKDQKGWYCHAAVGGCGEQWGNPKEPSIVNQEIETGPVERSLNPDVPAQKNTVLKMAKKRALVDAALMGTRSSNLFTQDIEDFSDSWNVLEPKVEIVVPEPEKKQKPASSVTGKPKAAGFVKLVSEQKSPSKAIEGEEPEDAEVVEEKKPTPVGIASSTPEPDPLDPLAEFVAWMTQEEVKEQPFPFAEVRTRVVALATAMLGKDGRALVSAFIKDKGIVDPTTELNWSVTHEIASYVANTFEERKL